MKRLRIAVIGAGHLGRIHARLLKTVEAVELVGVVDPISAARQRATDELEVAAFAHHYEVLGKIDAAIIATPTPLHHDVALEFLRSGVHCFVEKPICLTAADADSLIAEAKAQHLVLQVGHVERFNPALAAIKLPREPRYIEARRASGYTFRSTDVGVVLDLMIHDIDLALSLAGSPVQEVQATGQTVVGPHEDLAQARLTFANGCVANLWASRVSPSGERSLQVYTDDLHATFDLAARTAHVLRPSEKLLRGELQSQSLAPSEQERCKQAFFSELMPVEILNVEERNAILDEQHDFVCGIQGTRPVRVPGEAGRDALAVAEAILACLAERHRDLELRETLPLSRGAGQPASRRSPSAAATPLRRAG